MAGYHSTTPWLGHDRWECDECPYETVREELMRGHVEQVHARHERTTSVLGPDGKALTVDEPVTGPPTAEHIPTIGIGLRNTDEASETEPAEADDHEEKET